LLRTFRQTLPTTVWRLIGVCLALDADNEVPPQVHVVGSVEDVGELNPVLTAGASLVLDLKERRKLASSNLLETYE
jgi:hypothetical protein